MTRPCMTPPPPSPFRLAGGRRPGPRRAATSTTPPRPRLRFCFGLSHIPPAPTQARVRDGPRRTRWWRWSFPPIFLTRGLVQLVYCWAAFCGLFGKIIEPGNTYGHTDDGPSFPFLKNDISPALKGTRSMHKVSMGSRWQPVTKTRTIWRWRRGGPSTARSRPRCSRSTPTGTSRAKGGATCCMV